MTTILTALLDITLFSAVIFAAILIFQRLLRRRISAALNYAVWMLLILRLLVPVTIDSGWHAFTVPSPQAISAGQMGLEPAAQTPQALVSGDAEALGSSASVQPISGSTDPQTGQKPSTDSYQNTQQPAIAKPFDWTLLIAIIWAAGALGILTHTAIQWIRLNRRIARRSADIPEFVQTMADQCRRDLRIRRDIKISVQDWLISPALSASLKPTLLLPQSMLGSTEALRFGIRHELTHYKRRDHIINLLLLALRCVYWFNPVVWLAFRRIQTDMETACDAAVTVRMASSELTRYIHTMIDIGRDAKPLYALGMGAGRKALEKRVRGLFMAKRTNGATRTAAVFIALMLLIACFTTACQPTPEKTVIVNKEQGLPSEALKTGADEQPSESPLIDVPDTWTDDVALNEASSANINADISIPGTGAFPVYRLERKELTQDRLNELINYFAPGATFSSHDVFTKEYYEQRLIEAKRGQLVDGDYVPPAADDPWVKSIEEKLANAPAANDVTPADTDYDYYRDYDGNVDESRGRNFVDVNFSADGKSGSIFATRYERGNTAGNQFTFNTNINYFAQSMLENEPEIPDDQREFYDDALLAAHDRTMALLQSGFFDNFTLTQDEAVAQTGKAITDLKMDGMGIVSAEKAMIERYDGMAGFSNVVAQDQGYVVQCARMLGALSGYDNQSQISVSENNEAYAPPFTMETLSMVVTQHGIEAVWWNQMAQVAETVSENALLLPFKDIQERIVSQLKYEYATDAVDVQIDNVRLVSGYINTKDDIDSVWDIPVWIAQGAVTYHYENGDNETFSYLSPAFSALDGSVVYGQNIDMLSGDGTDVPQ